MLEYTNKMGDFFMKEIVEMLEKYRNGDFSRDKLFDYYESYAKNLASEYYGLGSEDEDILSSAYEELASSLEKLKEYTPSNIPTFINRCIVSSIKREIATSLDFRYIGIPRIEIVNILIQIKQQTKELGREPSEEEILSLCGSELKEHALRIGDNIENLDASFVNYEKLDTVQNGNIDIESILIYNELKNGLKNLIMKSGLTYIEKQVLLNRYFTPRLGLKELAVKLGVSMSYVRRLNNTGLNKLKKYYMEYILDLASAKESSSRIDVRGLTYKKRK